MQCSGPQPAPCTGFLLLWRFRMSLRKLPSLPVWVRKPKTPTGLTLLFTKTVSVSLSFPVCKTVRGVFDRRDSLLTPPPHAPLLETFRKDIIIKSAEQRV